MTQTQLAEAVNVSRSAVASWENGAAYPRVEILLKLSEIFECSIDELLKGESSGRVENNNNT